MPKRSPMIRVFVSSTFLDMEDRRRRVIDAIESFDDMKCVAMERFVASENPVKDECLDLASSADLLVLILAYRYGWIPDGETKSITQLEYEAAKTANVPRLALVVDEKRRPPSPDVDSDKTLAAKLDAFKRSLDGSPARFGDDANLVHHVHAAIRDWREKQGYSVEGTSEPKREPHADELSRYREALLGEHRWIRPVGFPTTFRVPIQLDDLYVPLRARLRTSSLAKAPIRGLDESTSERLGEIELAFASSIGDVARKDTLAFPFAERHGRRALAVLGQPGSGKTTLLRRIVNGVLGSGPELVGLDGDANESARALPVFVPLRSLRREHCEAGLVDAIAHTLPPSAKLGRDFAQWLVEERGHLLVLLDGLDEVGADLRDDVARWMKTAVCDSETSRFVVTSRFPGYTPVETELNPHVLALEIRALDDALVERFVRNWYAITERAQDPANADERAADSASKLLTELRRPGFAAARVLEMTSNPLLLTVICLVHRDRGSALPKDRVRLYAEATEILLERWRREANKVDVSFTADQARRVLQPIAYFLHSTSLDGEPPARGRTHASESELLPVVESALADASHAGTAAEFLHAIRDESGLLAGFGDDRYGFLHLGFQEYLAARHVQQTVAAHMFEERDRANELLDQLAARYGDDWWQEVWLLVLALQEQPRLFGELFKRVVALPRFADAQHDRFLDDCLRETSESRTRLALPFTRLLERACADPRAANSESARAALRLAVHLAPDFVIARAEKLIDFADVWTGGLVAGLVRDRRPELLAQLRSRARAVDLAGHISATAMATGRLMAARRIADLVDMVQIPAGTFRMGSPRFEDEQPIRDVTVATPFWLARTPITNVQYRRFVEDTGHAAPNYWRDRRFNAPDQPVVSVSFEDAQTFCAWLGKKSGADVRLPSEAEWEYACRGGTTSEYWFGDDETKLSDYAWFYRNSDRSTRPVARKPANPFDLFDMHGNVQEWCEDKWHDNYERAPADGSAWIDGASPLRVLRGGSYNDDAPWCRSTYRTCWRPSDRYGVVGFRPAMFGTE